MAEIVVVDLTYEAFCFADPLFFDEQRETGAPADDLRRGARAGTGWVVAERGIWRALHPDGHALPVQGWKIHVSATLDNADHVLVRSHEYCVEHRIAFKHLRSRDDPARPELEIRAA